MDWCVIDDNYRLADFAEDFIEGGWAGLGLG
jgi:hypothetical protein